MSDSNPQTETYEDEVWAVENEGVITYRLADWTPSGTYNELASAYTEHEEDLLEKAKYSDHIVVGTATVEKSNDGEVTVVDVVSSIDGHTINW
jgi:hypothetical protein